MVDPDAPTPQNPTSSQILHWMQPGLTFSKKTQIQDSMAINALSANVTAIAPYLSPNPPQGSSPHRYIQMLYKQPSNFTTPAALKNVATNASGRTKFNVAAFAKAQGLGNPVAMNFFKTQSAMNTGVNATSINGTSVNATSTGGNSTTGGKGGNLTTTNGTKGSGPKSTATPATVKINGADTGVGIGHATCFITFAAVGLTAFFFL
jgi:phosphatidylethanolamine-binding protein